MANLYGVSAYQQTNQTRNQSTKKKEEVSKNQSASKSSGEAISKTDKEIKISTWSPISTGSPLVPSYKDGVGMSIGDVQLSDKNECKDSTKIKGWKEINKKRGAVFKRNESTDVYPVFAD